MAGPFYFAWVAASETTFDPSVHRREDEDVFGFTVEHVLEAARAQLARREPIPVR